MEWITGICTGRCFTSLWGLYKLTKAEEGKNWCLRVAQLQIFAHKNPQSEAKRMQDVTQSRHDFLRVWCLCRIDDGWTGSFRLQCPETCSIIVLSWLAKDEKLNLSILFFKCWAFFSLNMVIYDISYMMYTFLNSHAGLKVYIDILIMTWVPNPTIRLKGYSNNQLLICIWVCVFFLLELNLQPVSHNIYDQSRFDPNPPTSVWSKPRHSDGETSFSLIIHRLFIPEARLDIWSQTVNCDCNIKKANPG